MCGVLRTWCPVLVFWVCLRMSASSLANDLTIAQSDPDLEKLLLEELINDVEVRSDDENDESGPQIKRFNPNSFGFSRGRRLEELAKRLNPASFSFSRGKRASLPALGDISGRYATYDDAKRAPPSGFTGMRGRRADLGAIDRPEVGDPSAAKRRPPEGYVVARGKRIPLSGYTSLPSDGFHGMRGRKRTAMADLPDWPVASWTKRAPPSGFQILRGKKSPPEGFMGLRGKRSVVEEVLSTLRSRTNNKSPLARERHLRDLADVMTSIRNAPEKDEEQEATSETDDDDDDAEKANFRRKFSKQMN